MPVLQQIIRHSELSNRLSGISGILMCQGPHVLQLLEGEQKAVESLFNRISADPRHADVQKLLLKPVNKRLFPEWGMGIADLESKASLSRDRLQMLINDIAARTDTSGLTVEARMLISDFQRQVTMAA
jgi:hypothetical protein